MNRISVVADAASRPRREATVAPAKAPRYFRSASNADRFAAANERRARHLRRLGPPPWRRANSRPGDARAGVECAYVLSPSARPSIAWPGLLLTNKERS